LPRGGRGHRPPLPAGLPGPGDRGRGHRRAAVGGVGRGREPAARAEGRAGLPARGDAVTATTRSGRRARITELLREHAVRSQTELLTLLARDGIEVTQATLSRDLLELRAEKVRAGRDLVYAVPGEGGDRTPRAAV